MITNTPAGSGGVATTEAPGFNAAAALTGFVAILENTTTAAKTTVAPAPVTTKALTTTTVTTKTHTTTTVPPPPEAKDNNAYCWLVTQSSGKEADLVKAHYVKARSIFACKGWSVFTDTDALAPVSAVSNIGSVKSKKGPWDLWYNTEIFMRAWDAVVAGGQFRDHSWTLKVDADTVFFPGRLAAHVGGLSPDKPWVLKSDGMLSAPIEVFSRAAVGLYADKGPETCTKKYSQWKGMRQEDGFFDFCMHKLGVAQKNDEHLLMSCGEADRCGDRPFLAFHPFESPALYDDCVSTARASEEEEIKDEGLTGFCCLWGTDCFSCTGGNAPNRSTYCGKNPKRCHSCGTRATWCQPPRKPVSCGDRKVLTLYHQTSPHVCTLIMQSNFRVGKFGWCGGGIYFAMDPQATNNKCIGPSSKTGCILQVRVDVGRSWLKDKKCNRSLLGEDVMAAGYDSVTFDPSDGQEYAVYDNSRILSIRRYGWWLPDAQVHSAHWDVPGR